MHPIVRVLTHPGISFLFIRQQFRLFTRTISTMPLHAIDHYLTQAGKKEKSILVTSGYISVNIHLQQRAVIDVAKTG